MKYHIGHIAQINFKFPQNHQNTPQKSQKILLKITEPLLKITRYWEKITKIMLKNHQKIWLKITENYKNVPTPEKKLTYQETLSLICL